MSEKIRCGTAFGIDLNQVLAWNRIRTYGQNQTLLNIEDWNLKLYIPGSTITIQKSTPAQGVRPIKEGRVDAEVVLEEEDFKKLFQCLTEKFSCDISKDSNLLEQAFPK
jgi:hypothetical protein